jgi:hypothetical protein
MASALTALYPPSRFGLLSIGHFVPLELSLRRPLHSPRNLPLRANDMGCSVFSR